MTDLGENLSEQETDYQIDSDDSHEYDDPDDEETGENETELDPKKILKILQPIIRKRIEFFEFICEQNTKKTIRTKNKVVEELSSAMKSAKFQKERMNSIGATPASIDAVTSSSNIVAVTPVKLWPSKGSYQEIEEMVTTTTVTTTTKKIRRVTTLDRTDPNTEHAKRKLSMVPTDDELNGASNSESQRKTFNGIKMKKSRKSSVFALQAPSHDKSIVLYEPNDAHKYDMINDDTVILEPDDLNQAILNKTQNECAVQGVQPLDQSVKLCQNETLIYQTGTVEEMPRVVKTKSRVDLLKRLSVLPVPKLCIKKVMD